MAKARNQFKRWSVEEEQLLLDRLGDSTIPSIARKLGRTTESVVRKLEKLGYYDIAFQTGGFRTYEFAGFIGVDSKTIHRWIKEEGLPAKQLYKDGKNDQRNRYYYIYPDTFWRWAKVNKHLINFAKIERGVILPEPDWLDKQIALDRKQKAIKSQAFWTPEEDRLIWRLFYQEGLTQEEIGKRVGRTRRGVQKRLSVLRGKKGVAYA